MWMKCEDPEISHYCKWNITVLCKNTVQINHPSIYLLVDPLPVCPFKVINKFCRLLMSDFTTLRESLQGAH